MNSKTVEQLLFKPGRVLGENAGLAGFKEVLRLNSTQLYYNSTQFITKQDVGSKIHYLHQIKLETTTVISIFNYYHTKSHLAETAT